MEGSHSNYTAEQDDDTTMRELFYEPTNLWTMIGCNMSTLGVLLLATILIRRHVETKHPVFALILLEAVCLCVLEAATVILQVLSLLCKYEGVYIAYIIVLRTVVQLHPCVWLVITYLRYYLHIKINPADDIDMGMLRVKARNYFLLLFLPLLVVNLVFVLVFIILFGGPYYRFSEVGEDKLKVVAGSLVLASNLPDVGSIILFLKMWKKLNTNTVPIANDVEPPPIILQDDLDRDFGGIWIGERNNAPGDEALQRGAGNLVLESVSIASLPLPKENMDHTEELGESDLATEPADFQATSENSSNRSQSLDHAKSVETAERAVPTQQSVAEDNSPAIHGAEEDQGLPQASENKGEDNRINAIKRCLTWHVVLSCLDVAFLVIASGFLSPKTSSIIFLLGSHFFQFWVPILTIKSSFRQFDNAVSDFVCQMRNIVCAKVNFLSNE